MKNYRIEMQVVADVTVDVQAHSEQQARELASEIDIHEQVEESYDYGEHECAVEYKLHGTNATAMTVFRRACR